MSKLSDARIEAEIAASRLHSAVEAAKLSPVAENVVPKLEASLRGVHNVIAVMLINEEEEKKK